MSEVREFTFIYILSELITKKCIYYLIFSVCGFNNERVLGKLEDTNLAAVEDYIRNDLPKVLENFAKEEKVLNSIEKSFFFSTKYAQNMADFKFMEGEKILIKEIVKHVKNSSPIANATKKKIKDDQKTIKTVLGQIFGEMPNGESLGESQKEENEIKEIKEKLELLVAKTTEEYKTKSSVEQIHETRIDLDVSSLDNIKAKITCAFCENSVNVSCKANGSWILSNLRRHFDQYCPQMQQQKKQEMQNKIVTSTDNDFEVNNQDAPPINEHKLFKAQITLQCVKMTNTVLQNEESSDDCECEITPKLIAQIKVCKIPADGDCLIGAAVHQIYHVKVNSDDYKNHVIQLRKNIVNHIRDNMQLYERDLMNRIYTKYAKKEIKSTDEACQKFLNGYLSQPGHWCGSESMKAISELFKTNIVIFSERGEVYFGYPFDSSFKNVLMFSYRLSSQVNSSEQIVERNHYDSVIKLDDSVIEMCSFHLLLKCAKLSSLNKIDDVINLE